MTPLPDLTLYSFPGACSQAVRITLHELSLPFTSVTVRFDANRELEAADGSLNAKEYRDQIHHSSYVPGFAIIFPDGRKDSITETPAILSYLASLVPEKNLAGKTELEKAKVLSWIIWLGGTLHGSAYTPYWAPKKFVDVSDEKVKEGVQQGGRRNIEAAYENLEERLGKTGGEWFVGDEVTLADLYSYIFYRWGVKEKFGMEKYKKYTEIARKLEARESVKKTLEEEGIPAHF